MHRPVQLPNESASCLAACIFPLCRRWSFELPRIPDPSASQSMNLRVAPHLLFCDASESLMRPRYARIPHLPALPTVSSRVAPRSLIPGCHCWMAPRVASHSAPSGGAIAASANHSAGCPAACLTSCGHGWADVTPRLKANLASPAWPRMNLCLLPAPAHSPLALDAISIELQTPCRHRPGARALNRILHRPASKELRFQFPGGHQLRRSLGRSNLWKQVQKRN